MDGYHDLETVFFPVPFHDIIETVRTEGPGIGFSTSGIGRDIPADENLCMKAYSLLKRTHNLPPLQLHLHKSIPAGAGLGGGSANAAFTLKLLNDKFSLNLTTEQLLDHALQLGSDCPFFIINKPCIATGRGELFEPVDLSRLRLYKLVIVNPGIHIPTSWAFSQAMPSDSGTSLKQLIGQPVESWKQGLVNDFEKPVFASYPEIGAIKEKLYNAGAVYASLSGSGSTVFGLFETVPALDIDHLVIHLEAVQ